jgi:hypothetical protein
MMDRDSKFSIQVRLLLRLKAFDISHWACSAGSEDASAGKPGLKTKMGLGDKHTYF